MEVKKRREDIYGLNRKCVRFGDRPVHWEIYLDIFGWESMKKYR